MESRATILVDTNGSISFWSKGSAELFGYRVKDVVGKRMDFLIPEQYRESHWVGFNRAMADPNLKDLAADIPVICADGESRYFAGRLLVLFDAFGSAVGAAAIFTDSNDVGFRPFG